MRAYRFLEPKTQRNGERKGTEIERRKTRVIKFVECGVHEPCRGMNNTLVKGSLRGRRVRGGERCAGICELSTNLFHRLTNAFGARTGK